MEGGVIRQGKGWEYEHGGVSPLYMGPYGAHHCKRWREKREGVQVWGIGGGFGEGFEWE